MARGRRAKKDEPLVYNSLDELLALLTEERRKTLRNRRIAKVGLGIYLGFVILMLVVGIASHSHGFGGMGGMFGGFTGIIASMYAATNTQKKGVQALAEFDDLRAVPRLIEMLEYKDTDIKVDAAMLLEKLLPKLKATDAPLLTPEHHAILNRILAGKIGLKQDKTELLRVATLQALQQIGDASSLPFVIELANGVSPDPRIPVAQAARECLPFLQDRIEHLRQTQTLLRASDGNGTPTDMLLRPAMSATSNTPAEELLRAAPETNTPPVLPVSTSPVQHQMPNVEPEQEPRIARLS